MRTATVRICHGMALQRDQYFSIRVTRILLSLTGFWIVENERHGMLIDFAFIYTKATVLFATMIEFVDLFHLPEDLYDMIFIICNVLTISTAGFKLLVMTFHRNSILNLISFSLKKFWHKNYESREIDILRNYELQCIVLIWACTVLAGGTGCSYVMRPLIENIGKNDTDRILPFKIWINLPLSTTPYFEIMYVAEAGTCFFCFDIFLCVCNIHISGQLEILRSRLGRLYDEDSIESPETYNYEKRTNFEKSNKVYSEFCNCIKYHEILIWYVQEIERIFTVVILGQMLMSSLLMCLAGFQLMSGNGAITKRYIFIAYTIGCVAQLITYTFTSNQITVESLKLADVAFHADWCITPYDKAGISIRQGVTFFMQRTQRPLVLTAGGFFPVTLDSFTKVISTAVSYFTILRERDENVA